VPDDLRASVYEDQAQVRETVDLRGHVGNAMAFLMRRKHSSSAYERYADEVL
jgi:hypothetical protein